MNEVTELSEELAMFRESCPALEGRDVDLRLPASNDGDLDLHHDESSDYGVVNSPLGDIFWQERMTGIGCFRIMMGQATITTGASSASLNIPAKVRRQWDIRYLFDLCVLTV